MVHSIRANETQQLQSSYSSKAHFEAARHPCYTLSGLTFHSTFIT